MSKVIKRPRLTRSKSRALIVVAHPDDETLFMLGPLLQRLAHRSTRSGGGGVRCTDWTIVCVTDADGNGEGPARLRLFEKACGVLGAKMICLGHPDRFDQNIDLEDLTKQLRALGSSWSAVYTHGPLGEYGHPHHQNVCLAVHKAFLATSPVWSVSNNVAADLTVKLTRDQFQKKADLLMKYYNDEVRKFLNLIPIHSHEAYNQLTLAQVHAIQRAIQGEAVSSRALGPYAWLSPLLTSGDWSRVAARFFEVYFSK